MMSSEDKALAMENEAIARMVGEKMRSHSATMSRSTPNRMPESLSELMALIETTVEKYPRETVAVATVIAFGIGALWRRGIL